jgi:hypothetical protein
LNIFQALYGLNTMSISSKEQKKTLSVFLPIKLCNVKSTFLELISDVQYSVGRGTIIRKEDQAVSWLFPLSLIEVKDPQRLPPFYRSESFFSLCGPFAHISSRELWLHGA